MSEALEFPAAIYVPWVDGESHASRSTEAQRLALALAARLKLPCVAVGATKDQLPDDWGKRPYRTLKSGRFGAPGASVEIHFWPSLDTLAAMPPRGRHVFVLEWGSDDLSGWARHVGAMHYDSKELLTSGLSDEAVRLYKKIDWNGNNAWGDSAGKRDALRDLRQLRDLGELDVEDLCGFMIGRHSNRAIRALRDLAKRA